MVSQNDPIRKRRNAGNGGRKTGKDRQDGRGDGALVLEFGMLQFFGIFIGSVVCTSDGGQAGSEVYAAAPVPGVRRGCGADPDPDSRGAG